MLIKHLIMNHDEGLPYCKVTLYFVRKILLTIS